MLAGQNTNTNVFLLCLAVVVQFSALQYASFPSIILCLTSEFQPAYTLLTIQPKIQEDPYSDFWDSFSAPLTSLQKLAFQIPAPSLALNSHLGFLSSGRLLCCLGSPSLSHSQESDTRWEADTIAGLIFFFFLASFRDHSFVLLFFNA